MPTTEEDIKRGGGVKKERGEREREGEEQYMFENLRSA